jgi:2-succinyl-5-enolpyruvyl-6-hydroxy-3-cyclohexene-1-carboxylate synthase
MGALTFRHDTTGVITCACTARPDLTPIGITNQGGGICCLVEHTEDAIGFDDLFAAPHSVDIARLAAANGWHHETTTTPLQLITSPNGQGPRVLEVRSNRDTNANYSDSTSVNCPTAELTDP